MIRSSVLAVLVSVSVSLAPSLGQAQIKHKNFVHSWKDTSEGTRCLRIETLTDDLIHFEIYERREQGHQNKCLREDDMIWITPMVDGQNPPRNVLYFDQTRKIPYQVSYKAGYQGPNFYQVNNDGVETASVRISVFNDSRCLKVFDKIRNRELTQICAEDLDKADAKKLRVTKNDMTNFYGVSDQFTRTQPYGDWNGIDFDVAKKAGVPGHLRGPNFFDGAPSTSQIPMVYNLGPGLLNYGLFFDQQYRMTMTFSEKDRYTYETYGDEIRFFVMTGGSLKDTRKAYLDLTGHAPVPPKSQFGYWTSKFGFTSFQEAENEVKSLRADRFPLDGIALDLQWFGGKFGNPDAFRMGVLQFVTAQLDHPGDNSPSFDNSDTEVPRFYDQYGVHFMPIEELYIDERLDEFKALVDSDFRNRPNSGFDGITPDDGCYVARVNLDKGNGWIPAIVDVNFKRTLAPNQTVWWGRGSMLDTSNPNTRYYWHQLKRRWLAKKGIFNHWLDLVEPEMFDEFAYYYGFPELYREYTAFDGSFQKHTVQRHGDIHNFYGALFQPMGIEEGYAREENATFLKPTLKRFYNHDYSSGPRHWTLFRAATSGSQRYGGLWSGDTASNQENANAQFQAQLNAGLLMDYFSGDSGGFFHINDGKTPNDAKEAVLWKQWFAATSLSDIPLRPHGWALKNPNDDKNLVISFAANVRGHKDSNRANVWRRYELIPYLYSLAHRAHLFAEPIYPPLVYYFQDDMQIRTDAAEKMIGESLVFKVLAKWDGYNKPEVSETDVYLPKGTWIDYENPSQWIDNAKGNLVKDVPLFRRDRVPHTEPKTTYYYLNPLYARQGSIIPKSYVDDKTMNALGKRWGEDPRNEMMVRVFSGPNETLFTLYEDDGVSRGYLKNEVQQTVIHQKQDGNSAVVTIDPAQGNYTGAPASRKNVVELVVRNKKVKVTNGNGVWVNNLPLSRCDFADLDPNSDAFKDKVAEFDKNQSVCWYQASNFLIRARTADTTLSQRTEVRFNFQ